MIKFSELKREKIYKKYENEIEVYNPTPEQQSEIISLYENKEIYISGRDLLKDAILWHLFQLFKDIWNTEWCNLKKIMLV